MFFSLSGESHVRVLPIGAILLTRYAAIIGSAVLYQEFRDVTLPQFINFAFGVSRTHPESPFPYGQTVIEVPRTDAP